MVIFLETRTHNIGLYHFIRPELKYLLSELSCHLIIILSSLILFYIKRPYFTNMMMTLEASSGQRFHLFDPYKTN